MLKNAIILHSNEKINFLIQLLIGVVVLALLSPIRIDIEGSLPITLQTLAVILIAFLFGWKVGFGSALGYVILGIAGVPVFPGYASGIERLTGMYGGFYFGFLMAAIVCGFLAEQSTIKTYLRNLLIWLLGHLIILLLGFAWKWQIAPMEGSWIDELQPLMPGMMVKIALGLITVHIIARIVAQRKGISKSNSEA